MVEPLRRVGRYELLEVIGRGGAAVVYLARQPDLDRHVALKELSPHHAGDPSFAHRFVEESRLAGAMSHPSVVTVHEYFEHDGLPYIAMEYLPRGSLRPYLATLTSPQLAGMLENVLAGLAHGESHGVIHRDLKPENLLVAVDGNVKIADFGVARALGNASERPFATVTGTTIGTPAYMAPEQALGEPLSPATDLYSLGIIVWEALAGHTPFESRQTPMAVLYRQVHDPVPAIDTVCPDVDPALSEWLATLLAKAPSERFPSAESAWDELEDLVIKLAGPRWRREARIRGQPAAKPGPHPTRVTPTITDPPPAGPAPATEIRPAAADPPPPRAASPPATPPVSPARRPTTGGETVIEPPRRHQAGAETPAKPTDNSRRRKPLLVAALVAVVGVVAGAVVGGITAGGDTTTRVTTTPATQLAASVRPILRTVEAGQRSGRSRLDSARTAHAQAAAAISISRVYANAARRMRRLPRDQAALSKARSLQAALTQVGDSWRALAAAASRGSRGGYTAASDALRRSERRLAQAALAAERGDSA